MADNPLPRYFFGVPPRDYDPNYMRELVRTFSLFQEQLSNPGNVTFDASAEVEQPVFFTGQGQVSGVSIESTYTISGSTATATTAAGSVTTASAYSLTGTAASATSGVGGVTVSIT